MAATKRSWLANVNASVDPLCPKLMRGSVELIQYLPAPQRHPRA
jgi:hypothetical protein